MFPQIHSRSAEKWQRFAKLPVVVRLFWSEADALVKTRLGVAFGCVLASAALAALAPVIFKVAVDGFGADHLKSAYWTPVLLISLYVLTHWLARSFGELRWLLHGRAEQRVNRRLSLRFFAHMMKLPLKFHLDRKTGALSQTLANGLIGYRITLQHLVFSVVPVAAEVTIMGIVLAHLHHSSFLAILGLSLVAYTIAFCIGAKRIIEPIRGVSIAEIDANALLTDSVLNYEAVKYFDAESHVQRRFDGALAHLERRWNTFYSRHTTNGLVVALIFAMSLGASMSFAAREVAQGEMTIGDFVLINAYVLQIVTPLEMLGFAFRDIAQGMAFIEKMIELMRQEPETSSAECGVPLEGPGELVFDCVSLSYLPDRTVLKDVSFTVPPGRTVAIVGGSGSGKSSLVRLLVRLYEPEGGRILLDGTPISHVPLSSLRQAIAVVPQDTVLFNDTIAYNIGFGKPASTETEIKWAAQLAHLHQFVASLPDGYQTVVGERGLKISGGERQRLAIARAALKRPRIFVFDEATSSLDTKTEREILRNLIEVSRGTTTIIIAHRLSTVVHADEILVLHHGEIAERGSHASLLKHSGIYAALWQAQQRGHASSDEEAISAA